MDALVSSGWVIDLVLVFVFFEAAGLIAYRVFTGRGLAPVSVALMLLPGACLLFALRAVLDGATTTVVIAWLTLALVVHVADLWQRWRGL
jgi:hypothetical protein